MSSRPLILSYQQQQPANIVVRMPAEIHRLSGDKALSIEACDKIAKFVLSHHPDLYGQNRVEALKRTPLNYNDLSLAISIINSPYTKVIRVDNEINRDPKDGLICLTTNAEVTQEDEICAALVRENKITLAALSREGKTEFLFVSDNGFNALNRYRESKSTCSQLQSCCKYITCLACVSMIAAAMFSSKQD